LRSTLAAWVEALRGPRGLAREALGSHNRLTLAKAMALVNTREGKELGRRTAGKAMDRFHREIPRLQHGSERGAITDHTRG
jgi:hypothetical protein